MTEQEQPEVVAVGWAEGEQIHGPEGDQISEPLRTLTLTLHPENAPIVRREWGNVLSVSAGPDSPLLRVESLECQYAYDHTGQTWWATSLSVEGIYCDDAGQALEPLRHQRLGAWGEDAPTTPRWAQDLVEAYRPASAPAPRPPRPVPVA